MTIREVARETILICLKVQLNPPLEGIFVFGIVSGLPNFFDLCRAHGIYADLCRKSNEASNQSITEVGCPEQSSTFSMLSTLAAVSQELRFMLNVEPFEIFSFN